MRDDGELEVGLSDVLEIRLLTARSGGYLPVLVTLQVTLGGLTT